VSEPNARIANADNVDLQQQLEAVQRQRRDDLDRMKALVDERDRLRYQISAYNASFRAPPPRERDARQNPAPSIIRVLDSDPSPVRVTFGMKIIAKLLLRFARREAKRENHAAAEILYQAIMLFRPRSFLLRQTGNMLSRQGQHHAAAMCFERVIAQNPSDAESLLAYSVALRHVGDEAKAETILTRAIALDPSMARRAHV
jgi:tetratricopeptide (TPR) repeat protein